MNRRELVDSVEETLKLFTAEDPRRNIAIAAVNTVLRGLNIPLFSADKEEASGLADSRMMSRGAAHAAIVLILSDVPAGYPFRDIADDILDAIEAHQLSDDAIDRALRVWGEEGITAYSAHIRDYLKPDGTPDKDALREADEEAWRLNRDLMRRSIKAATGLGESATQPP
jgi:hypothetical protein